MKLTAKRTPYSSRVAAERERLLHPDEIVVLRTELDKLLAAKAALARLDNPDEALVDALWPKFRALPTYIRESHVTEICRALAVILAGQENNDEA